MIRSRPCRQATISLHPRNGGEDYDNTSDTTTRQKCRTGLPWSQFSRWHHHRLHTQRLQRDRLAARQARAPLLDQASSVLNSLHARRIAFRLNSYSDETTGRFSFLGPSRDITFRPTGAVPGTVSSPIPLQPGQELDERSQRSGQIPRRISSFLSIQPIR